MNKFEQLIHHIKQNHFVKLRIEKLHAKLLQETLSESVSQAQFLSAFKALYNNSYRAIIELKNLVN